MEAQEFVVSKLFDEVFEEVKPAAEEKGIQLHKDNKMNGTVFSGDKQKVKTLISNILSNAVKFTPEGGAVEAEINRQGDEIRMCVKDTGIGINPAFMPHIFEQFRQADSSLTRKHGGLGLGLAISKHIAKLHHGTIEAKSEGEGKGSMFIVKLPIEKTDKS